MDNPDCSCDPEDDNFDPDCDCGDEEEITMPAGILIRAAALTPQTFNPDALTVDAVFASGTPVPRRDMLGRYNEVLSMEPSAADLSQFVGAPLLDSMRAGLPAMCTAPWPRRASRTAS
jgi:hypothetical protein